MARQEGIRAHMDTGVSAEESKYAALGIDPGRKGCQHYVASQLLFYRWHIDPSAYLILWQIGGAGDQSFSRFSTSSPYRKVLVDVLARDYELTHEVIIYRAATLPLQEPLIQRLSLGELAEAEVDMHSTLVIPPGRPLEPNTEIRERL